MNQGPVYKAYVDEITRSCGELMSEAHVKALASFLYIKVLNNDWNDALFLPSQEVEVSWVVFIGQTKAYYEFCSKHPGTFINRHVDNAKNQYDDERYAATYYLLKISGMLDENLWPKPQKAFKKNKRIRAEETFQVHVIYQFQPTRTFEVTKSTTIVRLMEVCANSKPGHLTRGGNRLSWHTTMEECGAVDGTCFCYRE